MSSRELVDELFGVFIETDDDGKQWVVEASFLPERSAFNTALRGGDSSPTEYREGRIINELAAAHAEGRGYDPWLSHAERAAEKAHEVWQKRRHDETLAELRGERR